MLAGRRGAEVVAYRAGLDFPVPPDSGDASSRSQSTVGAHARTPIGSDSLATRISEPCLPPRHGRNLASCTNAETAMRRILTALLLVGGLVRAAITGPSGTSVVVSMHGTAGTHPEGTTHELAITGRDGELAFQVPPAGLDTGIGSISSRTLEGASFGCSASGSGGATTTVFLALVVALRLAASHLCRRRGRDQAGDGAGRAGRHEVGD